MVVNLRRYRRVRADKRGHTWPVGRYRSDWKAVCNYTIRLDGVDVTNETFYVDGRRGIVRMYALNQDGHKHYDAAIDDVVTVERRGHVQLRRRKDAA